MSGYRVTTVSPEEGEAFLSRLRGAGPENKSAHTTAILAGGIEMKGSFEITAREASTGEVAWAHSDDNLITDLGRRAWMDMRFNSLAIGFASSVETPSAARCSIQGDSTQLFISAGLSPSNNSVTHTKTLTTTFGTPGNNRTLGTIWLQRGNDLGIPNGSARSLLAYALLTPTKTQTTTQTLEVVYKISMSPIY